MEDKNERKEIGGVRGGGSWRVACITPLENGFTKVNITVTAFVCNLCFSYYLLIPIPR